uniref:NADH dehydrogenase subunit 6 n=1 Tax=Philodina citrina TaxID=468664 RepID=K0JA06_9BILA|nr:NADH dehydrogenase subunit 6 [Philodina citrina]
MLFLITYVMYNMTYLFSVLCLVFLVMIMMMVYMSSMIYIKYLVILVYISGVVVFILYISCMCWNIKSSFSFFFIIFFFFSLLLFDSGSFMKFSDVSEYFWMFLFFSMLFSLLVTMYSLNLFKTSGSLRF